MRRPSLSTRGSAESNARPPHRRWHLQIATDSAAVPDHSDVLATTRTLYRRNVVFIYAIYRAVVGAATANLTYLLQTKTGTLLGRQGSDFLEDSAGLARNALKLWWVHKDSNLGPAD